MPETSEKPSEDREGEGRFDEPEFEDEPPGAILFEMRPRPFLVVWGAVNVTLVGALALILSAADLATLEAGRLPLGILWLCQPVSAAVGLVLTAFFRLNLPAAVGSSRISRWAFGLHLLAIGSWTVLSWRLNLGA